MQGIRALDDITGAPIRLSPLVEKSNTDSFEDIDGSFAPTIQTKKINPATKSKKKTQLLSGILFVVDGEFPGVQGGLDVITSEILKSGGNIQTSLSKKVSEYFKYWNFCNVLFVCSDLSYFDFLDRLSCCRQTI